MGETFTIFGGTGFVGGRLAAHLRSLGHNVAALGRANWPEPGTAIGHAVYAIGMTADFRQNPFGTVEAHVGKLAEVLTAYRFESLTYLSTTRVYQGSEAAREDVELRVRPALVNDIYNITKIAGEAMCLTHPSPKVRVARLSNVFGGADASPSFLASVLGEAAARGSVTFLTAPDSEKDYVGIDRVTDGLARIALSGRERLYNLAAGRNIANARIAAALERAGIACRFAEGAPSIGFPVIDTARFDAEFGPAPDDFEARLLETLRRFAAARPD